MAGERVARSAACADCSTAIAAQAEEREVMSAFQRLLPPQAASRLSRLEVLADTAQQTSTFAVNRTSEIRKHLNYNPDMSDEDRRELEKEAADLTASRNEAQR